MSDQDPLEQAVYDFIMDVCEVMYRRGYQAAPVGPIMRLIGVPESTAAKHDDEHFVLDESFKMILKSRTSSQPPVKIPRGVTLH